MLRSTHTITHSSHYWFRTSLLRSRVVCSRSSRRITSFRSHVQVRFTFEESMIRLRWYINLYGLDIVERFTLALMLVVVAFRNLIELSGSSFTFSEGFALPKSFGWFHGKNTLWIISYVSRGSPSGEIRSLRLRSLSSLSWCQKCS